MHFFAVGIVVLPSIAMCAPVERHIGVWNKPPVHTPTSMVSDGPLLGNGDVGVAVGGVTAGGFSFYTGKMDFWTQTGSQDNRHGTTHVAAGSATLRWAPSTEKPLAFHATQELAAARVNASVAYPSGVVNTSAIVGRDENVLLVQLSVDRAVTVNLTLGATNQYHLPITPAARVADGLLSLDRHANAWLDNAVVLTECDENMLVSQGLRGLAVDGITGRVQWVNETSSRSNTVDIGGLCPAVIAHPMFGNNTLGRGTCGPEGDGKTDWRYNTTTGHLELQTATSRLCAAYNATATAAPIQVVPCDSTGQLAVKWSMLAANPPEGGSHMLKAAILQNTSAAWGPGTACSSSCSAGEGCCDWAADGGCLTAIAPFLDIRMALAVAVLTSSEEPLTPSTVSVASDNLSATASFQLQPEQTYLMRLASTSTRPGGPPANQTALQAATTLAVPPALNGAGTWVPAVQIMATHGAWWAQWWAMSSVDLGPTRQTLEGFYYGAHYMLGCFSRVGGVTAGLLGPWSLQDPVGWDDHLTLDYNVEANFWGAATANRLSAMLPYFATMDSVLPQCRRRAKLKTWSRGGHAGFGTYGQQMEMMGCGPTSFSVMGKCPHDVGGYDGLECVSAMGAFQELTMGHDSSTRFVAGLMATPYVDYYEHSLDEAFLKRSAFPIVSGVADFYASYATADSNTTGFNLLYTCAQEICSERQGHGSPLQHNSLIDLVHAKMSLLKSIEWAGIVGDVDPTRVAKWKLVADGLPQLPLTWDNATLPNGPEGSPLEGDRVVWSESMESEQSSVNSSLWNGTCQGFADYFNNTPGKTWGCADYPQSRWWVQKRCDAWPSKGSEHAGCPVPVISCNHNPCKNGATCVDTDPGWMYGVCECTGGWQGRFCSEPAPPPDSHMTPSPFVTNYNYPIIHFSGIHPTNLVGLYSDVYTANTSADDAANPHSELLEVAVNTVWGDNERSDWHPVNGLCLAWPSATRVTDGRLPNRSDALLDRFENALNRTMYPNFWPSMSGGGLEQVGAGIAVDELLLQSHEGFIALFPAWGAGAASSFTTLRARGAFLVSAAIDRSRKLVGNVTIQSEKGARCRLFWAPWVDSDAQERDGPPEKCPFIVTATGVTVTPTPEVVRGVGTCAFNTDEGGVYIVGTN